ncbi:HAD-IIIC family phosphatase [Falsiroseomonas ponticola]|uniref:HAD-IIIC family phosphatase n=1 Tax=Falsiroseomonas ponticola TaxID=2786951 RepID=UPI0019344180|nr:HAD-IIIC family phosphatase [Roseomonas ponticola]
MPLDTTDRTRVKDGIARARAALASGDSRGALALLREAIGPETDFLDQLRAARLLDGMDAAALGLRPLRLAIAGASTLDHLVPLLRFWLTLAGFAPAIHLAPFDTARASVLDPASTLHCFGPDLVWLFTTHRDHDLRLPPGADGAALRGAVGRAVAARAALWDALRGRGCLVLENNADLPAEDAAGNLAGAAAWGHRTALRLLNAELALAAPAGVVLLDLDHLAARHGRHRWHDPRYWHHSKHAVAPDASGMLAHAAARLIAGARGLARKCLVLDLDNTLWGGVIGDDGLAGIALGNGAAGEAFVAFQAHAKALKDRGIILAACSKNEAETASLPFREHPDTVLRLEDFAVFRAGWGNKADALRDIAATLNIGLDALVFVDDNPMERDIVRRHLPDVAVVEMPEDPAHFIAALEAGAWFEAATFAAEDAARTRLYAENAQRDEHRAAFVDMQAYLASLGMMATTGSADPFHLPRIAQLIGKSNQFHLTGTRPTEAEIAALARDPAWTVLHIRLRDRFGDNGLIAALLLRQDGQDLVIDTWVMSCRVLARGVEEFTASLMLAEARRRGCTRLLGRYRPSGRNQLVAGLYARLGFAPAGEDAGTLLFSTPADRDPWPSMVQHDA